MFSGYKYREIFVQEEYSLDFNTDSDSYSIDSDFEDDDVYSEECTSFLLELQPFFEHDYSIEEINDFINVYNKVIDELVSIIQSIKQSRTQETFENLEQ